MAAIEHYDVICIGGGSGLTAAYFGQQNGKSIALVDDRPDQLGGTCLNRGCIPTKGLIQAAEVMQTIRHAADFGIHLDQSSVRVDFQAVLDKVRQRRVDDAAGVRRWVESAFTPYYGRARFVGDKLIEMEDGRRLTGERIFIAAGARPAIPPIPGLAESGYLTNESVIFDLTEQPEHLIILGGGYIGCEFAHFFSALGTRVTVIDHSECLLAEDDDVRALFTQELAKRVELVLQAEARQALVRDGQCGLIVATDDGERTVLGDRLLVATGRRPNTDGLALEKTGVELNDRGFVVVDDGLRTTHPDIYAYGDVIGQGMFKHTSSYEGELAYRNAHGASLAVDYTANPHAVFSNPQIGSVGLTERACRDQGLDYTVARKHYADFAKGKIVGSPPGFAKLLVEKGSDRILGFHMIGPQAADLIHEVVVAMNTPGAKAQRVRDSIHVHPTLAELVKQVFDATA
ncbi:dihydrolipoyl dehydrogenase family protein [Halomonas saccharevitans]|uniref:Dihydrolipoamide dehydrogenase n=1 Tax=Halomonas saccharevitans TaxID=416872 RepID=A0A1I7CXN6_9GAMM|nr:dihydrolipoyl dehydrogenase [Halomonas saccharevitans]SFU04192.1 dihydrolipoamide dehydrogenase [Halomonas saccharevitans]